MRFVATVTTRAFALGAAVVAVTFFAIAFSRTGDTDPVFLVSVSLSFAVVAVLLWLAPRLWRR